MPPRRRVTIGIILASVWAVLLIPLAIVALADTPLSEAVSVLDQVALTVLHTFQAPENDAAAVGDQVSVTIHPTFQAPESDAAAIGDQVALSVIAIDTDLALTPVPANITTSATSLSGAVVTYSAPTAVDEDSPAPTVSCTPGSGSTFVIGTTTVTCTATSADDTPGTVSQSFIVTVLDSRPTADSGGPYSGVEGASISITGRASDPDGQTVSSSWLVGSNASNDSGAACVIDNSGVLSTFVTCNDEGSYTLTLTVTDSARLTTTARSSLTVYNAAPSVGSITRLPAAPVAIGSTVQASVSFTDPGSLDSHTASWNWGDGSTSAGAVSESGGAGSVTGSHTYTAAGVYTVTVTVTDADGASGSSQFQFVVVYDPSAGFVTGGGWINSPPGAYLPKPSATGKASFGFVSKYQKGANVPTGNTQFEFHEGSLDFHSTTYQWLVIAGNCRAQFKGTGTINGSGSYSFLLTGVDGERCSNPGPDTFRIQITDNTSGTTVYDNATDQAIGGGDIQVHP
jgi:PKD repeat protein